MPSQRGAGNITSRARSATRVATTTATEAKKNDAKLWKTIADKLDAATIASITALVDRQVRERRMPSKHPAVQELRASLSGKTVPDLPSVANDGRGTWTTQVADQFVRLTISHDTPLVPRLVRLNMTPTDSAALKVSAEFLSNWGNLLPNHSDGIHIYTDRITPEAERLFYAILSVVLPRLAAYSDAIAAALPTMKVYFYTTRSGRDTLAKTTTVATRVRRLYGSD